jgi:hypothetical protein
MRKPFNPMTAASMLTVPPREELRPRPAYQPKPVIRIYVPCPCGRNEPRHSHYVLS